MQPIDLPIVFGASFAKWRRVYGSLTLAELVLRLRKRISARLFLWYRSGLACTFQVRNVLTRNAPLDVRVRDIEFQIAPEGAIAFHAWSKLRFEHTEIDFILRMLQPGITFFDAGANTGLFSLAAGKKLGGQPSAIYAFEPCPSTFAILKKNLLQNSLTNVHAISAALSDSTGEANLYVNAEWKDALNSLEYPNYTDAEIVGRERVRTITLDEFVEREGIARVDLLKVDVEGAERLVFRGGQKLLSRSDAPMILYEGYSWCTAGFHYHPVELMWQLEEFGYELFVLDSQAGCVRRRIPGESYDAMVVAAKPSHSRYGEIFVGKETV